MKRLFAILLLAVTVASVSAATRAEKILKELRNPKSDYVIVAAHRGDWRNFPENSLQAYDSAINMGVDIVEIDVRKTADGHFVICHDATVNRTTSGKGKVSELTLAQIKGFCLRAGQNVKMPKYKMPTLEEVLDLCKDRCIINIDKGYDYYAEIMPLLKERKMIDQVLIKGKMAPETVKETFSSFRHNMLYMPIIDYTSKNWAKAGPLFDAYLNSKVKCEAYEICWNGTLDNVEAVFDKVLASGAKLWVNVMWDSLCGGEKNGFEDDRAIGHEEEIYGKLLGMGATMFQTDRPHLLISYLDVKGRHTLP